MSDSTVGMKKTEIALILALSGGEEAMVLIDVIGTADATVSRLISLGYAPKKTSSGVTIRCAMVK